MDNPMPSTALAELSRSANNLKYLVARLPSYDQLFNIPAQDPAFALTLEHLDIGHSSYDTGGWRWVFASYLSPPSQQIQHHLFTTCRNLLTLTLDNSSSLSDLEVLRIATSCSRLRTISIQNCRMITELALVNLLVGSTSIEDVEIINCMRVGKWDKGMPIPAADNVVKRLKIEDCDFCGEPVLAACRQLQKLQLECCSGIKKGTTSLLSLTSTLEELDLTDSVDVTFSLVDFLDPLHFPNLRKLNLGGCNIAKIDKHDVAPEARKEENVISKIIWGRLGAHGSSGDGLGNTWVRMSVANPTTISTSTQTDLPTSPTSSGYSTPSSSQSKSRSTSPSRPSPSKRLRLNSTRNPTHPHITTLHFDFARNINDRTLRFIAGRCRNLRKIVLEECLSISDTGFEAIARLNPGLTHVNLERTPCGHITLVALAKYCPSLVALNIGYSRGVENHSVSHLLSQCPEVQSLELAYCTSLTDEVVDGVVRFGRNLKQINLQGVGIGGDALRGLLREGEGRRKGRGKLRCVYVGDGVGTGVEVLGDVGQREWEYMFE
ncbi:hypothetical protein HK097_007035 [Rhizophlyctis rosea]|uniref:RNI-like protein n=1 Tax=Rhizophlyctis rosea TaxID=64517 RepID=A0AAD5SK35_9FUNG|nr:hypothetical protein HK097_007035 [Rhizophlyctis rosea]